MDVEDQLVQGQGRGRGRPGRITSVEGPVHGRGRGRRRGDNTYSEVLPIVSVGPSQQSGRQEISEAREPLTGAAVVDIVEVTNSEEPPQFNVETIEGQGHGRGRARRGGRGRGRGRGRAGGYGRGRQGFITSTGGSGQRQGGGGGRGRGRGRGRGMGRGRGNLMQALEPDGGSSHESEEDSMELSAWEADLNDSDELPDPPVAELLNGAHARSPPRPRRFTMQKFHRSESVILGSDPGELGIRHHKITLEWNNKYKPYLVAAGLYGVHQIGYILADSSLITALVERWRPETHTFHLPIGEMAVTLQDVALLLGLRIDGDPIYAEQGRHIDWSTYIRTYLDQEVDEHTFRSNSKTAIKISWLYKHFQKCPDNKPEKVPYFARAYMLMLIGSVLFTDLSGDSIPATYLPFIVNLEGRTYSWGSAVLAYLHKELCRGCLLENKQMGGPVILLQLWSWTRFLFGRPEARQGAQKSALDSNIPNERPPYGYIWFGLHRWIDNPVRSLKYYRDEIDSMREYQVNWMPYEDNFYLLPPVCLESPELWLIKAPLINLRIVEPYNPHRVMRQFGKYQEFPPRHHTNAAPFTCSKADKLNRWNTRGDQASYVDRWNRRRDFQILEARPYDRTPSVYDRYMKWYTQNTILKLQPPEAMGPSNIHPRQLLYQAKSPNNLQACKELKEMAENALKRRRETMEVGTKAFALDMLLGLRRVLKILGHNVAIDETFVQLQEQLLAEEQQQEVHGPGQEPPNENIGNPSLQVVLRDGVHGPGEQPPNENMGNPSLEVVLRDGGSPSNDLVASGSKKRLRGG